MAVWADHAFKDIYNLPKPWKDLGGAKTGRRNTVIFGVIFVLLAAFHRFGLTLAALHLPWVGKPDLGPFYSPALLIKWWPYLQALHTASPRGVNAMLLWFGIVSALGIALVMAIAHGLYKLAALRAQPNPDTYGSARVATFQDVRRAGFFEKRGPFLGYIKDKAGREYYVRADLEGHTLVVAPTGSGKTTTYVYQLATTWKGSIFVYDLKGENWTNTAGFRASAEGMRSRVLRLSLSDAHAGNAHFNPMDIIRIGTPMEYLDTQDLVEVITDPEGKGNDGNTMSEGHFLTFAASLLIASTLYVKYKYPKEKQNLANVLELLSDPSADSTLDILKRMRDEDHDPDGRYGWVDELGRPTRKNKYIVGPAVDIILMSEESRSSMISTCKRYLKPYRNPVVAAATAYSDFDILDLVNPNKNISLYLVVAPSSKDSLKPVTRLIINMIMKKLTERKPAHIDPERRLHLVLDEFDSLGKLPVFVDGIQFLRGYGMDCSIIIQGQNQLISRYGAQEMITAACKNVVIFTPNDDDTCKKVSERLGSFTIREKVPSSGRDQKESYRDFGRKLLEPNEVAQIAEDRALIFVRHHLPMYLHKRYAFHDAEFSYRISVPPPFDLPEHDLEQLGSETAADRAAAYAVGPVEPLVAA